MRNIGKPISSISFCSNSFVNIAPLCRFNLRPIQDVRKILNVSHGGEAHIISKCPNLLAGDILVKLYNGEYNKISNLSLGDKLYGDDMVIGLVKQKLKIFTVNNYSCNNIIGDKDEWILISDKFTNSNISW